MYKASFLRSCSSPPFSLPPPFLSAFTHNYNDTIKSGWRGCRRGSDTHCYAWGCHLLCLPLMKSSTTLTGPWGRPGFGKPSLSPSTNSPVQKEGERFWAFSYPSSLIGFMSGKRLPLLPCADRFLGLPEISGAPIFSQLLCRGLNTKLLTCISMEESGFC